MTDSRRTLVIVCGGTIVMSRQPGEGLDVSDIEQAREALKQLAEEVGPHLPFDFDFQMAIDGTDLDPQHLTQITEVVASKWQNYRAVVILSGTNTLAYFASALSFSLRGIPIPVVLTGGQLPASELYSDARMNFINSLRVASLNLRGVFVVFGHRIILGSRAKKVSESKLDAFESFNYDDAGEIGVDIHLNNRALALASPKTNESFVARAQFGAKIECITLLLGTSVATVNALVDIGCSGIIFRSHGSGDIPKRLFPALEYAREKKVPIVNTTQCRGSTLMGINEVGRLALEFGVIQAYDMSMEAMSTKAMWLSGQKTEYEDFPRLMHTNLAGEISSEMK